MFGALIDGAIRPLGEVLLDGKSIEELLLGMESVPANIVPFPLSARTAGVA